MLYKDEFGFFDVVQGDGMNSAKVVGVISLFQPETYTRIYHYVCFKGNLIRHPFKEPWDNPGNFSRDQLIPLLAGMSKLSWHDYAKHIFWAHFKRFFFCQNHERDKVGSEKWRCPHWFDVGNIEVMKWFDQPDFLWPHHIWHLIFAARIKWLYWFAPIGWVSLFFAVLFNRVFNQTYDDTEIICLVKVAGRPFVWFFKLTNPMYVQNAWQLWVNDYQLNDVYPLVMHGLK